MPRKLPHMEMDWEVAIGARLREAREGAGLSRPKVSDFVTAHVNTVIAWEKGEGDFWAQLPVLAKLYDRDLRWLLHGHEWQDPLDLIAKELAQLREVLQEVPGLLLERELGEAAETGEQRESDTGEDAGGNGRSS